MSKDEISLATDDQLREWARNASATFLACAGHNKAARNRDALQSYQIEMARRNMPDWGSNLGGTFNGPGSF